MKLRHILGLIGVPLFIGGAVAVFFTPYGIVAASFGVMMISVASILTLWPTSTTPEDD